MYSCIIFQSYNIKKNITRNYWKVGFVIVCIVVGNFCLVILVMLITYVKPCSVLALLLAKTLDNGSWYLDLYSKLELICVHSNVTGCGELVCTVVILEIHDLIKF